MDLAVTPDGQYLYAQFPGVPTDAGGGAVFVFNIPAIESAVKNPAVIPLLTKFGVDDIDPVSGQHADSDGNVLHNVAIDTHAAYGLINVALDQKNIDFGVYDPAHAPLAIGFLPRGIAVQTGGGGAVGPSPIVLPQGQTFNGNVGSVTFQDDPDPSGLSAEIYWGDGASSTGTLTEIGSGTYEVSGQHTWNVDGTYLAVAAVAEQNPPNPNQGPQITGTPILVLPLTAANSLQGVDPKTLRYTAVPDFSADSTESGNSFDLTLEGSVSFALTYDLGQPDQKSHYNSSGYLVVTGMEAEGTFQGGGNASLTLMNENISLTQEAINSSIMATYDDTSVSFNRTETDSWTLGSLYKTADFVNQSFSLTQSATLAQSWTDTGVAVNVQRLDGSEDANIALPENVHDLMGSFTSQESQTQTLTRHESGTLGHSSSSYGRVDTITTRGNSSQTGTNLGMSYTLIAQPWELVDLQTVSGESNGNYTLTDAQSYGSAAQVFTETAVSSTGDNLTIKETDVLTLTGSVSFNAAAHSFSASLLDTSAYQVVQTGTLDNDSIGLTPSESVTAQITATGNEATGDYQIVTTDPSMTESVPGDGENWSESASLTLTVSGNFFLQSLAISETKDGAITDNTALDSAAGSAGNVTVGSNFHEVETISLSSATASVSTTVTDTYTNDSITAQGAVANDPRWSSNPAELIDEFIADMQGPGAFLLAKDPLYASDGTLLIISGTVSIDLPDLGFSAKVYGDFFGNFVTAGVRTGGALSLSVGVNLPYTAVMANAEASVQVFAQAGNWLALGTYLELNLGASFSYSREIDNPNLLPTLNNIVPSSLTENWSGGMLQAMNDLTKVPTSLNLPPTQLPGAPQGQQIDGVDDFESSDLGGTAKLKDIQQDQKYLPVAPPAPTDITGFNTVPSFPANTGALPTVDISNYNVTFSVGLKLGNKILDKVTGDSKNYLQASYNYSPIDGRNEVDTWYDPANSAQTIQTRTVTTKDSTSGLAIDGQIGVAALGFIGGHYTPGTGMTTNFTTTTTETNQTRTIQTTETGTTTVKDLRFYAIVGITDANPNGRESSYESQVINTTVTTSRRPPMPISRQASWRANMK